MILVPDLGAIVRIDSEVRSRIDSFVTELNSLVKLAALEAVHATLSGGNWVYQCTSGIRIFGRQRRTSARTV